MKIENMTLEEYKKHLSKYPELVRLVESWASSTGTYLPCPYCEVSRREKWRVCIYCKNQRQLYILPDNAVTISKVEALEVAYMLSMKHDLLMAEKLKEEK